MALSCKVGSFNTSTAAAGNTVAVSGLGFQPKVVLFWWTGRTDTTDSVGRLTFNAGFGYAISTSDRRYATYLSEDTAASMVTNRMQGNAACIGLTTTADGVDGLMDLQSMDSDGFTLVIDDAFTADYTIHYMALGGSTIVNVQGQNFTKAGATGNQSVEDVSFLPNFILFFSSGQTTIDNTVAIDGQINIGAAKSSSNQYTLTSTSDDGASSARARSYNIDSECIALFDPFPPNHLDERAQFVDFHSSPANGFTVNWVEATALASVISYIAFQFSDAGNVVLGDLLTQTDTTTDIAESGFGWSPAGAMFLSHATSKSTADTSQDDANLTIGAFSDTATRTAAVVADNNASADAVVSSGVSFDEIYINVEESTGSMQGEMDIKSVDSGGFTCIMDDADPAQAFVWYMAFGAVADSGNPWYAYAQQ